MVESSEATNLENHFILAMPELGSAVFYRSVIYICEHTPDGAMGIIINRPLTINLQAILEKMQISSDNAAVNQQPVYFGGPLQTQRGFILHSPDKMWDDSVIIQDSLCITSSQDILQSMAKGEGPLESLVALGYSGWTPGQLEEEMKENAWLSVKAEPEIAFKTPVEKRWEAAAALLGIDVSSLSGEVGHS